MLKRLHPTNSQIEHLFVGTDRFMYFVISWDTQTRSLRTEQTYVDQTDKTARDSFNQDRCLLDPTNEFIALQIYDGIVIIFPIAGKDRRKAPLENTSLGEPVQIRISDLFVISSAFLYPRKANDKPKMAFLYVNSRQEVHFKIRQLNFTPGGTGDSGSADLEEMKRQHDLDVSLGATHLIPVPAPACTC